jgi:NADH:ubiquinone oxidoreductase subunit 6 (subunit J)
MSAAQNLSYSLIQVVHNFGAVATVGGSVIATRLQDNVSRRRLAHLVLGGWVTQVVSGATFGMVTYHFYHQLPDISGIAVDALDIKMVCATLGIVLLTTYLWQSHRWTERGKGKAWISSSVLAITAISAAAFLRWFS